MRIAAYVFTALIVCAMAFQVALAAGAPWGTLAMGGRFPGRLPPAMRVAAVAQGGLLACMGFVVLARAGVMLSSWAGASRVLIWVVVGIGGASLLLNLISRSTWERRIWAPVGAILLVASLVVALG
jgi:hypothetical protein